VAQPGADGVLSQQILHPHTDQSSLKCLPDSQTLHNPASVRYSGVVFPYLLASTEHHFRSHRGWETGNTPSNGTYSFKIVVPFAAPSDLSGMPSLPQ
jgi:hypothetical protein